MGKENDAAKQSITIDPDTLKALIDQQVAQRMRDMMGGTADEQFKRAVDSIHGRDRPPLPEKLYDCKSPVTGSTFKARVVPSRAYPQGRVVELRDYVTPPEADIPELDGGKVPRGMFGTPKQKLWKYETFWKRDLLDLVGKPFQHYYTVEDAKRRDAIEAEARKAAA